MITRTCWFAVVFAAWPIIATSREPKPIVTYTSDCSCERDHADTRWEAKIDATEPPTDPSQITQITPSEMYAWNGPGISISRHANRIPAEIRWYAMTGRVDSIRAEEDGDLHIVLVDADGAKPGKVVVEIPLEARWCQMRTTVFSWTDTTFPFDTRRGTDLNIIQPQVVRVVGRCFYDMVHAGRDTTTNRRPYDPSLAVWEIHPVMQLTVIKPK